MTIFKNSYNIHTAYIVSLPIVDGYRVLGAFDAPHEIQEKYKAMHGAGRFVYDGYDGCILYMAGGYHEVDEYDADDINYRITLREQGRIMHDLASYITDYLTEEQARNPTFEISQSMIFNAIEAYEGGAR